MRPGLLQQESLFEYFKRLIDEAIDHQRLRTLDETRFYLVRLLAGYGGLGTAQAPSDEPLALRLLRALEEGGSARRRQLRALADAALFMSGFFSDRLARQAVSVGYCARVGGFAYQELGSTRSETLAPTFAELGSRFLQFADVLTEVSEQSALTSDSDLLRLYERWLEHGSARSQRRLLERGIIPTDPGRSGKRLGPVTGGNARPPTAGRPAGRATTRCGAFWTPVTHGADSATTRTRPPGPASKTNEQGGRWGPSSDDSTLSCCHVGTCEGWAGTGVTRNPRHPVEVCPRFTSRFSRSLPPAAQLIQTQNGCSHGISFAYSLMKSQ